MGKNLLVRVLFGTVGTTELLHPINFILIREVEGAGHCRILGLRFVRQLLTSLRVVGDHLSGEIHRSSCPFNCDLANLDLKQSCDSRLQ
jgi:hypothetical protein